MTDASPMQLIEHAAARAEDGAPVSACLVVHARGSTPQTAGALMLVGGDGETLGTIGGGCVEAEVRTRALEMRARGATGVMRFKLDHDYGWDDGLICGGTLDVAVGSLADAAALRAACDAIAGRVEATVALDVDTEDGPRRYTLRVPPRDRLYIAGAGHVGQALARLALPLDYDVIVFDDRRDLLDRYVPDGAATRAGDIAGSLRAAPIDDATACVVVTRGHQHDEQALHVVLGRGAGYVGMIGSRRKVKLITDDLIELGVDRAELERVHAPIGLDIGAVTVEEIALAIAAQLVEHRRRTRIALVEGPLIVGAVRS